MLQRREKTEHRLMPQDATLSSLMDLNNTKTDLINLINRFESLWSGLTHLKKYKDQVRNLLVRTSTILRPPACASALGFLPDLACVPRPLALFMSASWCSCSAMAPCSQYYIVAPVFNCNCSGCVQFVIFLCDVCTVLVCTGLCFCALFDATRAAATTFMYSADVYAHDLFD